MGVSGCPVGPPGPIGPPGIPGTDTRPDKESIRALCAQSDGVLVPYVEPETLADRVLRQVDDGLDYDRLHVDAASRKQLLKHIDCPREESGWTRYLQGLAFTIEHGKAKQRRSCEVQLVKMVIEWYDEVERLMPDRLSDLREIVRYGCSHPAKPEQRK